jgi:indole-3-glycerol phosphate synthase
MLERIVVAKRQEVAKCKERTPLSLMREQLEMGKFSFSRALRSRRWSLIAECKLASPVKGQLCSRYSVVDLAAIFSEQGAAALSIHTSSHFSGKLEDMATVRKVTSLPILRKDFIIDPYQIYEARWAGADAILLIAAILTPEELVHFQQVADSVGLDCLVEIHSRAELDQVAATPAHLVGINNRNLKTFQTDIQNTFDLLPHCRPDWLVISESGIHSQAAARQLQRSGISGILVGEGLVRAPDVAALTWELTLLDGINERK